jgi:iron complex outermembrane receptor protein
MERLGGEITDASPQGNFAGSDADYMKMSKAGKLAVSLVLSSVSVQNIAGQVQGPAPIDLRQASLEDLMDITVTSVSRKEQKLSKTGAAVFVINQEDIRRSGATNIPDLLRTVPGVDVAQIDANTWAISIRGFNDRYADKVLVLVDGRTVYTPTTSGVYWDQLDVPLEDIDRIEVTRGPGGTVWGANAVNGVINILTKSADATQGTTVSAGGGSQGTARGLAQYGGEIGQSATYRVFGDYSNQGNLTASDGISGAADGWHMSHGGFRSDWKISPTDSLTSQGDFVQTGEGQTINVVFAGQLPLQRTFNDAVDTDSGNLLTRWTHKLANGSDTSLQVYFDRYNRHDEGVHEALNTLDIDFQHHLRFQARHDIVWGAGYRVTADDHTDGYGKSYTPVARTNNLFSTFVQDEISLADSLSFTLGAKFEHNAYTGFAWEPGIKLLWQPTQRQAVWVSASRAIVQTSREEANLMVDQYVFPTQGGGFGVAEVLGNPQAKAETLYDFEAGYRVQVNTRFSLDIATFSSYYDDLSNVTQEDPFVAQNLGQPYLVVPYVFEYVARAHTYGAEIAGVWSVRPRWRITPSLSAIHLVTSNDNGGTEVSEDEDNTPQFQAQIRSSLDLTKNLDWDVSIDHVGRLRDGGDGAVPAYNRLDTRLAWRAGKFVELSVVGQNLLTPLHAEFHNAYEVRRTLVERSGFGKITWRF